MNRTDAAHLARSLMNQHGLSHLPFEFDRSKRRLGCTHWLAPDGKHYHVTKITLSAHYVDILPEDEIRDVILHEIAHALAPAEEHHGAIWKMYARRVGAKPQRCAQPSALVDAAIEAVCPNGHKTPYHRLPLRVKTCGRCSTNWNLDYVLTYKKNGRTLKVADMPRRFQQEWNMVRPGQTIFRSS